MPIAANEERLSRRAVLALPLMPLFVLSLAPLPRREDDAEIVVVDGWVLRRSDLSQF